MSSTAYSIAESRGSTLLSSIALLLLACSVIVGFSPLQPPRYSLQVHTSGGTAVEAVAFGAICLLGILAAVCMSGARIKFAIPIPILMLLAWSAVSVSWSEVPYIAFVRLVQCILLIVATFSLTYVLSPKVVMSILAAVLGSVIIGDLLSILFLENAVHAYDLGETNVGTWKGLHSHKNLTGAIAGVAALIFLERLIWHRRLLDAVMVAASAILLIGAKSKTSIIVFGLVVCGRLLLPLLTANLSRSRFTKFLLALAGIIVLLTVLAYPALVSSILDDPDQFTGRSGLWSAMLEYSRQEPMLGSGFGSFWRVGDMSPILRFAEGWPALTGEGHNGFLDALVTLGLPGLFLSLFGFFIVPLGLILSATGSSSEAPAAKAVLSFVILHNLLETSFLVGNSPLFFLFIAAMGLVTKQQASIR